MVWRRSELCCRTERTVDTVADVTGEEAADERGRGPWLWSASGLLLFVIVYVAVAFFYAHSTRLDVSEAGAGTSNDPRAIDVVFEVSNVDATASVVGGTVQVYPGAFTDDADTLTRSIRVDLVNANLTSVTDQMIRVPVRSFSTTFERGRSALGLSAPVEIRPEGNYQAYPFDTMVSQLMVFVTVGGSSSIDADVPVNLTVVGDAPGWLIRDQALLGEDGRDVMQDLDAEGVVPPGRFATELYLARAGSTKTFVILLLLAMIVLGVLALLVARAVRTRHRRIEATMASWFAAMLFAVIPLRLNMPGSPPIGVWIDFLVLLWVELALMIGLAVFIGSWLRYSPPPATPRAVDSDTKAASQDLAR